MNTGNIKPDYTLLQRLSPEHVELQFEGVLNGQRVTWHAHIRTLKDYCQEQLHKSQQAQTDTCVQAQPFIDINIQNHVHQLTVALNLPAIDEPAIMRTIIMIRQYKRLQTGRHQYGEIATFNFASQ
ncbi:MAG TPA: hypothetical protein VFY78_13270 [Gammaproteobacteria bacterium]|nr:hypothetical protein [Gammaproteobacteria bacterium]